MRPMRDFSNASTADTRFIASARDDVALLLTALKRKDSLDRSVMASIEGRSTAAATGPWRPYLASDGGLGGTSVIQIANGDEPDMYLWLDDVLAPDVDFEFVADARQVIPSLLLEVRARDSERSG